MAIIGNIPYFQTNPNGRCSDFPWGNGPKIWTFLVNGEFFQGFSGEPLLVGDIPMKYHL